jgi:hypothetical protein
MSLKSVVPERVTPQMNGAGGGSGVRGRKRRPAVMIRALRR